MPTRYFLASGVSEGYTPLNAFDGALLQAGIGNTNIVKMSSIVPPHCKLVAPIDLPPGALVPTAYAAITSDVPGEIISAGVAIALPEDEESERVDHGIFGQRRAGQDRRNRPEDGRGGNEASRMGDQRPEVDRHRMQGEEHRRGPGRCGPLGLIRSKKMQTQTFDCHNIFNRSLSLRGNGIEVTLSGQTTNEASFH